MDSVILGRKKLTITYTNTGDSPPISQKLYTLLKHTDFVQKQLETLEKACAIVRSISPWGRPLVVVPVRTDPGQLPEDVCA